MLYTFFSKILSLFYSSKKIEEKKEKLNTENGWKLLLDEKEIGIGVDNCADWINVNFEGKDIVIVCILKGAVYFYVDLTRKVTVKHSCYFVEASSYKNEREQGELEILSLIQPSKFKDKHVILLDELYDNGVTLDSVKTAIVVKGMVPPSQIHTCTLFRKDRSSSSTCGGTGLPLPDFVGITIPNVWVVGYGLDHNGQHRNATCLYQIPN